MPAVNFALGAFLEAWLCMLVFGGLCHGMLFVLCGMLMQSVSGTSGDQRFHILSNAYRIPDLNNLIVMYVLLSPNFV